MSTEEEDPHPNPPPSRGREKTILVTRPLGDELSLTEALHERGYRVIHEPLTSILLDHTQRQALQHALDNDPDAVIVTSRHGVQALAALSDLRDIFLICVGEATAKRACSLGFHRVSIAEGNVRRLAEYIRDGYDEGSRFLYLSGAHVQEDMAELLNGMQVRRLVLYEAVASERLSDTLIEQLRRGQLDGVTFLSQRAARIFTELLAKTGIPDATRDLHAFCLSEAIAGQLAVQAWRQLHVAQEATLASVVECVDNVF